LIKQPIDRHVLNNLKLDYYYGAELKYVKNYLGAALYFYFLDRLLKRGTYWLPAGGSTPLGILGYVNAILELKNQIDSGKLPEPGYIFVAAGTTGTMAGIELGLRLMNMKSKVMGIQVTDRMVANIGKVKNLVKKSLKILQTEPKLRTFQYETNFELTDKFYGGQYGRVTKEGQEAVELIKKTEDITLETTYTGKTLAGLIQFIRDTNPVKPVLFWNTYNSVDLSSVANQVDYRHLPKIFHPLFELRKQK
jgi:D-cysteine desulfhydrase